MLPPMPIQVPLGDCYLAAGKFIGREAVLAFSKDYRLVHGNLARLRQDVRSNHAWVEEADLVHEVSNGQHKVFSRAAYYQVNGVTCIHRYMPEEALRLMIRHGHWGPWEEE